MRSVVFRMVFVVVVLAGFVRAFEIDPLPKGSTLTDVFNTNCLQMTQSQQMLKGYIMVGLGSTFDDPAGSLKRSIPVYDHRFKTIRNYFQSRLKDSKAIAAFNKAQTVWNASKKILMAPPTQAGAIQLKKNFAKMIPLLLQGSKPAAKGGLALLSLTGKLCRAPMKITID